MMIRSVLRRVVGEKRLHALKLAVHEYDNAMYFSDWKQRRTVFRAMDVADVDEDPRAETVFYYFQDKLGELNEHEQALPDRHEG